MGFRALVYANRVESWIMGFRHETFSSLAKVSGIFAFQREQDEMKPVLELVLLIDIIIRIFKAKKIGYI